MSTEEQKDGDALEQNQELKNQDQVEQLKDLGLDKEKSFQDEDSNAKGIEVNEEQNLSENQELKTDTIEKSEENFNSQDLEKTLNLDAEDEENEANGKVYSVDAALRNENESDEEFIARAKRESLGEWIESKVNEEHDLGEGDMAIGPGANELSKEEADEVDDISALKEIRLQADEVGQLADKSGIDLDAAVKNIFYSKAWLGKLLHFVGAKNPYVGEEKVKTANQIPPTADQVSPEDFGKTIYNFRLLNHVEQLTKLRSLCERVAIEIENFDIPEEVSDGRLAAICKTKAWTSMREAKFDLGFELAKLRK